MPRLLDILVPEIPGTNFAGNGDNDAVQFLIAEGRLSDGFTATGPGNDLDFLLENRGLPTNAFDELALNHDLDRINPNGSTRSGFENVRSDLTLRWGHLEALQMAQSDWLPA